MGGNKGAVYAVVGSSGKVENSSGQHPMVRIKIMRQGSMLLDFQDSLATARWFDSTGTMWDKFQIVKNLPPVSVDKAGKRISLRPAPALFGQSDRVFRFAPDNAMPLRVFTMDGRLVFDGVPKGDWEASRKVFPAGDYYFRHGAALGKISLR
jgi:hypothetical protein